MVFYSVKFFSLSSYFHNPFNAIFHSLFAIRCTYTKRSQCHRITFGFCHFSLLGNSQVIVSTTNILPISFDYLRNDNEVVHRDVVRTQKTVCDQRSFLTLRLPLTIDHSSIRNIHSCLLLCGFDYLWYCMSYL